MNSNRNFSFSKRLLNFNNRKFNKSSIKKIKKFDEIKTSLSFNNFNIYNQNLNNYSIENTLNELLLKRMTDISFITGSSSKNKQTKKQRKINLINVNNFFSPQINIIKVNKLNEKKIVDNKSKGKRKENVEIKEKENEYNNNIIQKYHNFRLMKKAKENRNISKIKLIQEWWKGIYNIIKIQKNIRGFLFRNKLLENLEQEKIIICNIFVLYKAIRKIVINLVFEKLKKYIYKRNNSTKKENLIKKKLFKGTIREKDITNITYINNYNNNFINNSKINKEKLNIKDIFTINNNNSNNFQYKKTANNFYSTNSKLFNKSKDWNNYKIIKNISFINNINTNNINNNYFYNKFNKKYIQKKDNINDQMFPKIQKNKYSLTKNKSTFESSFNNLTNITISTNKYKKENIDHFKNKFNKKNNNNKISVQSRNFIETNKSNILSNYFKNKNNMINKNSSKKINNVIDSYKNGIKKEVKFKIIKNKKLNCINDINNIKNNLNKNKKKRNEKMLFNSKSSVNNIIKNDKIFIIRYYFSFWKEITEKKMILKKLKNYNEASLTLKSNMFQTAKKKLYNYKIKKFKKALFRKGLGFLIKKILIKCILYKYFMRYNHIVNRILIFQKLKILLKLKSKYNNNENNINFRFMGRKEQYKIIPKRIKCKKKIGIEKINKKNNKLILSTSLISFNAMKFFSNLNNQKQNMNKNLNYSNQNLKINSIININKSINNNYSLNIENNSNKKDDIKNPNLIMQINQLKMIFNLLELQKNKNKNIYYFKKWKKNIDDIKKINEKTPKSKMEENRTNKMIDRNRNLTTKYRIMKYFSPYKKEYRDYSYKNKDKSLYSRDSKDKSRIDFTNDSKNNLNNTNYNFSNFKNNNEPINISINMIYKKKLIFDGNRTSRNNISDYSALLESKNIICKNNNDNTNYDKNINKNICNLFNQTLDNTTYGERFYKRINKIEEREIFFTNKK